MASYSIDYNILHVKVGMYEDTNTPEYNSFANQIINELDRSHGHLLTFCTKENNSLPYILSSIENNKITFIVPSSELDSKRIIIGAEGLS